MKTLVVYYSMEGNTKFAAQELAKEVQGDLLELVPQKAYPTGKISKFIFGGKAATFGEKPKLKPYDCDCNQYDLILIGTPIWNSRITPPLNTFLRDHDLSEKTIALFASSAGGDASRFFDYMKERYSHIIDTLSLTNAALQKEETEKKVKEFAKNVMSKMKE
ncbi:flavodoxin family protein [Anaerosporobacter faecicola]|uniref:flavodoxin family protein n=1 Tax=Anaerosporobacter faecicola TaxID=2718714 RepID=UPI00143AD630|nr:flavodoxin [Anaerosporobacter faecicola]